MRKAVLIEAIGKGVYRITERGRAALKEAPKRIDAAFLKRYPEFVEFATPKQERGDASEVPIIAPTTPEARTPDEEIEASYGRLRRALEVEVLDQVKNASPRFFERLVVELLVRMGYGGTMEDAGKAIGRSGDGGIDGIIKEDPLGLDVIYIQAKRWENTVGRPEIQKFAGALQGRKAKRGVVLTTASFTKDAHNFVREIDSKIVLIDGEALVRLMFDHNVGVVPGRSFVLKKLDPEYFTEE